MGDDDLDPCGPVDVAHSLELDEEADGDEQEEQAGGVGVEVAEEPVECGELVSRIGQHIGGLPEIEGGERGGQPFPEQYLEEGGDLLPGGQRAGQRDQKDGPCAARFPFGEGVAGGEGQDAEKAEDGGEGEVEGDLGRGGGEAGQKRPYQVAEVVVVEKVVGEPGVDGGDAWVAPEMREDREIEPLFGAVPAVGVEGGVGRVGAEPEEEQKREEEGGFVGEDGLPSIAKESEDGAAGPREEDGVEDEKGDEDRPKGGRDGLGRQRRLRADLHGKEGVGKGGQRDAEEF